MRAWAAFAAFWLTLIQVAGAGPLRAEEPGQVRFNRDVRPILAEKCFHCHGPDAHARQADLRLDQAENALAPREGFRIITPGKPEESDLYNRITATADSVRMPPPDQERQLTPAEIDVLKRWIAQGAEYEPHWALIPPQRPPVPRVDGDSLPRKLRRSMLSSPTSPPMPASGWSTGCWPLPAMANGWRSTGSTPPAMPTRAVTRGTSCRRCRPACHGLPTRAGPSPGAG